MIKKKYIGVFGFGLLLLDGGEKEKKVHLYARGGQKWGNRGYSVVADVRRNGEKAEERENRRKRGLQLSGIEMNTKVSTSCVEVDTFRGKVIQILFPIQTFWRFFENFCPKR